MLEGLEVFVFILMYFVLIFCIFLESEKYFVFSFFLVILLLSRGFEDEEKVVGEGEVDEEEEIDVE